MAHIKINGEKCKGCGYCISVCPQKAFAISRKLNSKGYSICEYTRDECRGCGLCAVVCPDCAIEIIEGKK
ncbi:MAG: 4Fe-4S binding protein [bacterium]|nr:4Fe-4S binding protein [bacterium]